MGTNRESFMRSSDAFSWYNETDPALRATIVAVLWLDRRPDWAALRARVDAATQAIPRLRQVVRETPVPLTPPRWLPDRSFDLSWHLRCVAAPDDRSTASVLGLARVDAMTAFDRSRPLWHFTVVEHLPGGRAALIMKLHHSLTDGVGAMRLAPALFDRHRRTTPVPEHRPEPVPAPAPIVPALVNYHVNRIANALGDGVRSAIPAGIRALSDPVGAVGGALRTIRSIGHTVAPVQESLSPVMRDRGLARDLNLIAVDLAGLAHAARLVGATVNDAFLTAVTGSMRRYHQQHHSRVAELRVTMPISIRTGDDPAASNRISLLRLVLPVSEPDPRARMRQIHRASRRVRSAPSLGFTDAIAGGLDLLPTAVTASMLKRVDLLVSDVTGMPATVYLAGAKVTGYGVFGPTMGCAANLTLMSYAGRCHIGINTDSAAVPDPEVFLACLHDGFDEVLSLADDLGSRDGDRARQGGTGPRAHSGAATTDEPQADDGNNTQRRTRHPDPAPRREA